MRFSPEALGVLRRHLASLCRPYSFWQKTRFGDEGWKRDAPSNVAPAPKISVLIMTSGHVPGEMAQPGGDPADGGAGGAI